MNEFIENLIGRLEELRNDKYMNGVSRFTPNEKKVFDIAETIVNQLAEEYKNQNNDQDLMIVESLPSLYPLQPFEVEALHRVVECSKGKNELVKGDLISRSAVIRELNGIYLDNPYDDKEDILEKAIGIVDYFPAPY